MRTRAGGAGFATVIIGTFAVVSFWAAGPSWGALAHATASAGATTAPAPSARSLPAMCFDGKDGYLLLFGGWGTLSALNDTWIRANGTWTLLHPSPSPVGRAGASIAYDAKDGYVVLFGGTSTGGTMLNDTWKFSAGVWTQLSTSTAPTPRYTASMAYDAKDGHV